ncbi:hypothetical protein BD414DRAFT_412392 [Trametes punicea]|nr:hypothetical protein BD414DRAFT_412392 [Trametes punicea]
MSRVIKTAHYEAVCTTNKTMFIILPTDESYSDADPARAPQRRSRSRDAQGLVNYYEEADQSIERMWREKLGRFLYDHVVKEDMAKQHIRLQSSPDKIFLANFPAHYKLWVHKKGDPHDPRKDHYLYGEPSEETLKLEPGSPSKILSRRNKATAAPSPKASAAARDLLSKFARTNLPGSLARALPSYLEDPDTVVANGIETQDSWVAHQALRIQRAKCCWQIIKEGFIVRGGAEVALSPRKRPDRRTRSSMNDNDNEWGDDEAPAPVSEHAWGVLGWMLTVFERDEVAMEQSGQVRYSPLLLSQIPPSRVERAARWDVDLPLDIILFALQQESESRRSLGVRLLALLVNLGSTTLLDFPMFLNAVSARISRLSIDVLTYLFAALPVTSAMAQFKAHLCKHALGGATAEVKRKPQARARAQPRRRRTEAADASADGDAPPPSSEEASLRTAQASVARKFPSISAVDILELLARATTSDPAFVLQALCLKSELVLSYGLLQKQVDESDKDLKWSALLRDGSLRRAVEEAYDLESIMKLVDAETRVYVEKRRVALLSVISVWQL